MPINSTKVAVIGGFLLLGLVAVAVWLLASASPASAQTDDTNAAPQSALPAAPVAIAPVPVDVQVDAPEMSPLPVDLNGLNGLTPAVPSVADVVPPALQPAVSDVSGLLPAPVRAPIDPLLSNAAPPPPRVDVAPGASVRSDAIPPAGPSAGASATADAASTTVESASRWWPASPGHNASEFRASDSWSHEGGTRAPPSGVPPAAAAQGSLVSSSAGRDFGQSMLLFGVVAAGILFLLGRGRRLWREATGWLPAPWCLLIERPG